ncbi:MAG TPA: hypothetical protein VH391_04450 [Solirubrobacterales bacterium]
MGRAFALAGALVMLSAGTAGAAPIASSGPAPSLPSFSGSTVTANPLPAGKVTFAPQNPFMAANPGSNVHNDTWMTDTYHGRGPVGRSLQTNSASQPPSICVSLAFDSAGRIVTVCGSNAAPPQARVIVPRTLATLATHDLPQAPDLPGTPAYQNVTGGAYFFLDEEDRIWVPTKTDHILVIGESNGGHQLSVEHDYDLTGVLDASSERITSALPDFAGRVWFVSKQRGKVGILDPGTGRARVITLGEEIENSFAVGPKATYIVSDKRMYRLEARRNGVPRVVWSAGYRNSHVRKPGQIDAGSGTTPTVMRGGYVAITDNADPMDVVVYRTARRLALGQRRVTCTVPVFGRGASATENSLIGSGNALIVENNYGYQDPLGPSSGAVTRSGFARIDVESDGSGCRKVWTNHEVRAPTVVPKLSTRTGLIYAYARPPDPSGSEGYYWTAIDFRTGRTAWSRYAGSGLAFNNNYSGLALGPHGTAFLGVGGGIISLRDGS